MADENEPPPVSKLTRTKQRWAREGRFLTGKTSRPDQQRLPPGQHLTRDWPVLDLGLTPQISRERWRLDVYGAVENPVFWDFAQFTAQPQTKFTGQQRPRGTKIGKKSRVDYNGKSTLAVMREHALAAATMLRVREMRKARRP